MFRRIFRCMLNETETFFKMLADSTRLRCLLLMQAEGELCVCELTHALNLSQPKISRHLAHLREAGVLVARRNGTWMKYHINPDLQCWALNVLQTTLDGVRKTEPFISDRKILDNMADRPGVVVDNKVILADNLPGPDPVRHSARQ